MKKAAIISISLVVVIVMVAVMFAGCTTGVKAGKAKEVKLTIWINGRDSFIGPDEQKKPQETWYISQAIKRFEEKNPGVTIELTVTPDALQAHQTFKTAGLAGNAPDIANLWTGQYIFGLKDVCADIKDLIPKEDKEQLLGWDTVTVGFQEGGQVLGYPTPDNQNTFFLYNKTIIKDCGLDFENNPPRTKEDFLAACQTIKDKGYIPMATDEGAEFPYYFFYIGAYWWIQQTGREQIVAEDTGKANFVDDQGLINALKFYNEIYAKGYMNEDAATSSDSWNKFLSGQVAMNPNVSSVVGDAIAALGEDNVGVILPPDISADAKIKNGSIGGPGQSLVISKNCKDVEMAVKFCSFLNSKEEVLKLYETQVKTPIRKDLTPEDLKLTPGTIRAKLFDWSKNYVFWVDNTISAPVVEDFAKLLPLVLVGKMAPEELAAQLDKDKGQQ